MANGELTARVASLLHTEFDLKGYDVLHDHREKENVYPENVGKLPSWFGHFPPTCDTSLADLDIAIVSRSDSRIHTLVEIEETTNKPK
jgi:hypothetical protein